MIIVSAGMRKAGTYWYYSLTNSLLVAAGYKDVSEIKPHFPIHPFIGEGRMRCKGVNFRSLTRLTLAHFLGDTFPARTHSFPSPTLPLFAAIGAIRATYLYRDPRDVVVSLLDHAAEARNKGIAIDLVGLHTLQDSIQKVKRELECWTAWMRHDEVLKVRYEDLVADTEGELRRLADYISVDVSPEKIREIAGRYERDNFAQRMDQPIINQIHLNKGVPGRFKVVLKENELALCEEQFGSYLELMGYPA